MEVVLWVLVGVCILVMCMCMCMGLEFAVWRMCNAVQRTQGLGQHHCQQHQDNKHACAHIRRSGQALLFRLNFQSGAGTGALTLVP